MMLKFTLYHTKLNVVLHCLRVIHLKSTQRELCLQIYKDRSAAWLNKQMSEVLLECKK